MIRYRITLFVFLLMNQFIFSQITISIGKVTRSGVLPAQVFVPVNVSSPLNNVKSISMQFSYDRTRAAFNHTVSSLQSGILNFALPDFDNLIVTDKEGLISLSWTNAGTTLGAVLNGKIFDMDFNLISGFSEIRFIAATIKDMQGRKLSFSRGHGSVSANTDPAVRLVYPNGGENLEIVGSPVNIKWTSVYIANVNLEYSTDNGSTWETIVENFEAVKNSYTWTVPNTINSAQCKLKISDVPPGTASDESDAVFTINSTPEITLVSPNGGEELKSGGVKTISWKTRNILNVKLEYCINASAPSPVWQEIISSVAASGSSYEWIIPNSVSTDCKLRITDLANPSTVSDLSNAVFTIHNHPINVSISRTVESKINIIGKVMPGPFFNIFWWWKDGSWDSENAHQEKDGIVYDAKDVLDIGGTAQVSTGWLTSLQYLEMHISYDPEVLILESLIPIPELKNLTYSYDDGIIHVLWGGSTPVDLHGKIFDLKFRYVQLTNPLQWIKDNWSPLQPPVPDPRTATAVIDPRNFSDIKVEFMEVRNSRNDKIDAGDWSHGKLSIINNPAVKLLAPADNDTLEVNDEVYNIKWAYRDVPNITLRYSSDYGLTWNTIVSSVPSLSGSYTWTLPNIHSTQCLIRIASAEHGSINDVNTYPVMITNVKSVNLTSPDGGEIYRTGLTKNITWLCRNLDNVKIEYSKNIDTTWNLIAASVPAKNYKYEWVIPAVNSTNCKVRIRDVSDTTKQDLTTMLFTISTAKTKVYINNIISPAGNIVVPVISEQIHGAVYLNFSIKYNPAEMELDAITKTALSIGQFNYNHQNGVISIVWFNTTPITFTGELFRMKFKNYTGVSSLFEFVSPNQIKDNFNKEMDIEYVGGWVSITDVDENQIPLKFALAQNYPNPFNPATTIRYEIPEESHVVLTIYNMLGEKVSTLVNETMKPGYYNIQWNAVNCASGIYYYSVVTKEFSQTKKMILLR